MQVFSLINTNIPYYITARARDCALSILSKNADHDWILKY